MQRFSQPVELKQRTLLAVVGGAALVILLGYLIFPALPLPWRTAGSPEPYVVGVAGALLLLVPMAFSMAKRGGRSAAPRLWFIAHIMAGSLAAVLVTLHSAAGWNRPPALLVVLIFFLVIQGYWARTKGGDRLAMIMASRPNAFLAADPKSVSALQNIISAKRELLAKIDVDAFEGTFSLTLRHWLKQPGRALAYARLAGLEANLLGARRSAGRQLANWRRLHMIAAWLLVAGLVVHVVTVTLYAGYVADGGDITWWHLAEWAS